MDLKVTEYVQTADVIGADTVYQQLQFNGVAPLLVEQPKAFCVLHQAGRAVAWFARMLPPAPLVESPVFLQKPKVEFKRIKDKPFAWETTWDYVMAVDDAFVGTFDVQDAEKWPAAPSFAT